MISQDRLKKLSKVADQIIDDMEADAKAVDGKPFTGKSMGELFGQHYATTQALAKMVKELIDDKIEETPKT